MLKYFTIFTAAFMITTSAFACQSRYNYLENHHNTTCKTTQTLIGWETRCY